MKNIYDALREKEGQFKQLEREIEALRTAARLLADDNDAPAAANGRAGLSQPQMIRAVLLDAGTPLHMRKILAGIKQKFGKKLKPTHLTALVYRYKKRGKLFYKAEDKPNTFGLLEWQISRNPASGSLGAAKTVQ